MTQLPFYFYAWIASLSAGCIVLTTKFTSKYSIKNPWLLNLLWIGASTLLTIPPTLILGASWPLNWLPIILAGGAMAIWNSLYISTMYKLDVSTISPLFNFRSIFAVFLGVLFLDETFNFLQIGLIITIVLAGVFATIDDNFNIKSFWNKSIGLGVLAMFFLALGGAFTKQAVLTNDVWTTSLWIGIINTIFILPTIYLIKKADWLIEYKQLVPVGAMAVFQMITSIAVTIAFGVNVGITSLIMAAPVSFLLAVLVATIVPNMLENYSKRVYIIRFIASIAMIVASIFLVS